MVGESHLKNAYLATAAQLNALQINADEAVF
jgi:hypothetical protein